jgi:hypothetical protein
VEIGEKRENLKTLAEPSSEKQQKAARKQSKKIRADAQGKTA